MIPIGKTENQWTLVYITRISVLLGHSELNLSALVDSSGQRRYSHYGKEGNRTPRWYEAKLQAQLLPRCLFHFSVKHILSCLSNYVIHIIAHRLADEHGVREATSLRITRMGRWIDRQIPFIYNQCINGTFSEQRVRHGEVYHGEKSMFCYSGGMVSMKLLVPHLCPDERSPFINPGRTYRRLVFLPPILAS